MNGMVPIDDYWSEAGYSFCNSQICTVINPIVTTNPDKLDKHRLVVSL